ncbi:MAG: S8 family serine peptidase [Rhodohalobacter sp.]|uniref:S8 family serine peptidase n=1 Tax=Rhodohalobacter sp. TaxID=1974210 RepID=UPI0039764741
MNIPPPQSHNQISTQNGSNSQLEKVIDRYIIILKDQQNKIISNEAALRTEEIIQSIKKDLSISEEQIIHQYKYALKGFAVRLNSDKLELLKKDDRIDKIIPDFKYKAIQISSSSNSKPEQLYLQSQNTPWGVARVGGPLDGTGKKAWILDTGIDLDHPDLNVDISNSASFVAELNADDGNGHGTHVAGIIAAKNNSIGVVGVASNAEVVSVKVCDDGGYCYTSDVKAGIDHIASNASSGDVANISLGWPVSVPGHPYIDLSLSILEGAIENAADNGILFTIAAGNEFQHSNNKSPARMSYNNVYVVSAHDEYDTFASFSNYGNPPINFSNPGVDIYSLWKDGGLYTESGTSMAAPHLAGLLLASQNGITVDGYVNNDPDSNPDPIAIADKPLAVEIGGPGIINDGDTAYFNAHIQHAEGPVSYQWYYRISENHSWILESGENQSSYSRTFYNPGNYETQYVKVEIQSNGESATDIHQINVISCDTNTPKSNDITPSDIKPC